MQIIGGRGGRSGGRGGRSGSLCGIALVRRSSGGLEPPPVGLGPRDRTDSRLLEMPRILCRGIFVLWLRAGGRSCNVAFSLSPSVPPLHFSPWAGEPLWAGWVTGEPPKSASVTAEAGKLPTLRVRPFWPFQVAVSRLPSMIVMGSPGSIRKAPGSVTSLTQRPSESQAS